MLAVERETHAERLAETILRENVRTSWIVEFNPNSEVEPRKGAKNPKEPNR